MKNRIESRIHKNGAAALVAAALTLGAATAFGDPLVSIALTSTIAPNTQGDTVKMEYDGGTSGYGVVSYEYQIGTTEVTNAQYAAFLNAVGVTESNNTLGLYNSNMGSETYGGIQWSGDAYVTKEGFGNKPVNFVSIYDAMRFTNWLTNGATAGASTENGVYTLVGNSAIPGNPTVGRNLEVNGATLTGTGDLAGVTGTVYAIASENEWYKAAYWKGTDTVGGDNYFDYAGSDTVGEVGANYNNYHNNGSDLREVAGGLQSASGTYDQNGNVLEFNDTLITTWNSSDVSGYNARGVRGGSFSYNVDSLASSRRDSYGGDYENDAIGFRVAALSSLAAVPEPGTYAAAMGLMMLITGMWIRRGRGTL
ncbi:MAG: SUMF1/EgtB/PvdO family nonheme iron enzyme [Opitutaceae bacterium]|jgi:formylglycine-generating enzyme required for sulfatase activity|nr:SUMF1/EgtB/PvdO family nonheme iron enzyme [Opitutaceae bacterium]